MGSRRGTPIARGTKVSGYCYPWKAYQLSLLSRGHDVAGLDQELKKIFLSCTIPFSRPKQSYAACQATGSCWSWCVIWSWGQRHLDGTERCMEWSFEISAPRCHHQKSGHLSCSPEATTAQARVFGGAGCVLRLVSSQGATGDWNPDLAPLAKSSFLAQGCFCKEERETFMFLRLKGMWFPYWHKSLRS